VGNYNVVYNALLEGIDQLLVQTNPEMKELVLTSDYLAIPIDISNYVF
jgi:hypothetical protein